MPLVETRSSFISDAFMFVGVGGSEWEIADEMVFTVGVRVHAWNIK